MEFDYSAYASSLKELLDVRVAADRQATAEARRSTEERKALEGRLNARIDRAKAATRTADVALAAAKSQAPSALVGALEAPAESPPAAVSDVLLLAEEMAADATNASNRVAHAVTALSAEINRLEQERRDQLKADRLAAEAKKRASAEAWAVALKKDRRVLQVLLVLLVAALVAGFISGGGVALIFAFAAAACAGGAAYAGSTGPSRLLSRFVEQQWPDPQVPDQFRRQAATCMAGLGLLAGGAAGLIGSLAGGYFDTGALVVGAMMLGGTGVLVLGWQGARSSASG